MHQGCLLKPRNLVFYPLPIFSDVWNPTCNIHDQTKDTCVDMGIGQEGKVSATLTQLTKDYQANMKALREATLKAGKFAWQVRSQIRRRSHPMTNDLK